MQGSIGSQTEELQPLRIALPLQRRARARAETRVAATDTMVMHGGAIPVDGIEEAKGGVNAVIEERCHLWPVLHFA